MSPVSELRIKNMVCDRCIRVVREELGTLGIDVREIQLGRVVLNSDLEPRDMQRIQEKLGAQGFELLVSKKAGLVEQIKAVIIEHIRSADLPETNENLSAIVARTMGRDYSYLSNLFSSVESITIERFTILQKIERVKELLVYDEHTLSEIAYQLRYSSVQHLSSQFKKITGLTPSHFKIIREHRRQPIDKISRR